MGKKKKTVWHKKQGHFIPSVLIKPQMHHDTSPQEPAASIRPGPSLKKKIFAQQLSALIKKAARETSPGQGHSY